MSEEISIEKRADRIAVLTLNRPAAMNAINRAMTRALRTAIAELEADDAVDVMVMSAAGERAFCAGVADAAADADVVVEAIIEQFGQKAELFRRLDELCKPGAILATNSSNIRGSRLAAVTGQLLKEMHERGEWGKKTGKGFYTYPAAGER